MIEEERIKPSSRIRDILLRRSVLFAITTLSFGACILLIAFGLYAKPKENINEEILTGPATFYKKPEEVSNCIKHLGVQVYPHPDSCDRFYKCTNGTLTEEACENGLLFDEKDEVHNHCNYYWAVNCGSRTAEVTPISSEGCEYQFGIFPISKTCDTKFNKCVYGIPEERTCESGLAYDDRIHACNWPDLIPGCDPEKVVNFTCPTELPPGDPALKFSPFPRFAINDCTALITCVNDKPRLIKCEKDRVVNEYTLTCDLPENVPRCYKTLQS